MSKIIWIMLSGSIYLWRVFWALENENEIICYQNRIKTIIQIVPFHKPKLDADWALANAIKVLGIFSTRHPSTWLRVFWSGYYLKIFKKLLCAMCSFVLLTVLSEKKLQSLRHYDGLKIECAPASACDQWSSQEILLHWLKERVKYIEVWWTKFVMTTLGTKNAFYIMMGTDIYEQVNSTYTWDLIR